MKKLLVIVAAALSLTPALVSCGGSSNSNLKTPEDSLAFYLGQTWGYGVAGELKQGPDSAKFNKAQFMKGLEVVMNADTADASFLQGIGVGLNFQQNLKGLKESRKINIDAKVWLAAFKKAFMSDSVKDPNANQLIVQDLVKKISEQARAKDPKAVENKKAGQAYINKVAKEPGVQKTANGVYYKVVKEGTGSKFKPTDVVMVKYEGKHINGQVFDNGQGREVPMSPQGVVPGMAEALQMMSPGAHYIIYIPSELAYGIEGAGPIQPNETLIFDVQTIGLQPQAAPQAQGAPVK